MILKQENLNLQNLKEKKMFKKNNNKKSIREAKAPFKNFEPLEYPDQLWNTREDGSLDIGHVNDEPSLTQQQFADECDINNILKSYQESGEITHLNRRPEIFGDFSNIPELSEAMQLTITAQQQFDSLPAKVRAKFNNDPRQLVQFCSDKNNLEEAIEIGLADRPQQIQNDQNIKQTKKNVKGPTKPDSTVSPQETTNNNSSES